MGYYVHSYWPDENPPGYTPNPNCIHGRLLGHDAVVYFDLLANTDRTINLTHYTVHLRSRDWLPLFEDILAERALVVWVRNCDSYVYQWGWC